MTEMTMKRGRRAALAGALLMTALLLGGCMAGIEERPMTDLAQAPFSQGPQGPQEDAWAERTETVTLYFFHGDGTTLVPVTRRITVGGGTSRAEAALCALLDGPFTEEAEAFGVQWPDMGQPNAVRRLEVSGDIATVDLPARVRELGPQELFAVRQAVTNTLTEFAEISYVNVLVGGREEGLDLGATVSVGTLTRAEDPDTAAKYARLEEQRQSGERVTRLATLYFPTTDGRFILPEVRSVDIAAGTAIDSLYTLLGELGRGTDMALAAQLVPAPMSYIEEMPEIIWTEDGAYRAIEIRFSALLDEALDEAGLTRAIYAAMLTDTLMGFIPGVEGLRIVIGEESLSGFQEEETPDGREIALESAMATRSDFGAYLGAPCVFYAQGMDEAKLRRVSRAVAQSGQDDPRERLTGLMRLSREEGVLALPQTLSGEDVLAVYTGEDEILVNLSERFAIALASLDERQERIAVYAMVNTLTEGGRAQVVRLYFEGEQRELPAGGVELRGALMRNPGMVEE